MVGANLVEAAGLHGWQVRAMHRKSSNLKALAGLSYETTLGDVTEPESLAVAMKDVNVVFHVAAVATYWKSDIKWMYHVNIEGTRNVLQAAHAAGVKRVVYTSSASVLGQPPFGQAVDETAPFNMRPEQFHYGYTKVLAEQVCQEFVAQGLDVVILNPSVIMGPRDVNVIGGAMVLESAQRNLFYYAPGGVNMVDVADVCEAHLSAALRGRPGQRYIIGAENLWHKDIFGMAADVVGKPRPTLEVPAWVLNSLSRPVDWARRVVKLKLPIDGQQMRFSTQTFWFISDKARAELGLKTRPFLETVQRAYGWYKANGYLERGLRSQC